MDESQRRFTYYKDGDRHYIVCHFTPADDAQIIAAMVEVMHDSHRLIGMVEGHDYVWESASMIWFKSLRCAVLYYLSLPH